MAHSQRRWIIFSTPIPHPTSLGFDDKISFCLDTNSLPLTHNGFNKVNWGFRIYSKQLPVTSVGQKSCGGTLIQQSGIKKATENEIRDNKITLNVACTLVLTSSSPLYCLCDRRWGKASHVMDDIDPVFNYEVSQQQQSTINNLPKASLTPHQQLVAVFNVPRRDLMSDIQLTWEVFFWIFCVCCDTQNLITEQKIVWRFLSIDRSIFIVTAQHRV